MNKLTSGFAAAILIAAASPAWAVEYKAKQMILFDASTNSVLESREADTRMFPSSMSKLMTLYVLFEKLKEGGIKLDSTYPVSEKAWRMGGSEMFVDINTEVSIEDLIRGIIVQSGNDACIVVAEGIGGSEEGFAKLMNEAARKMGLTGSHFVNSSGWPDDEHYMTARDLLTLSVRLVEDFPEYYHYFAEPEFTYHGITQQNRNTLIYKPALGVDGLKTGHTEIAGYGIALSAKQEDRRLFLVVNGLSSMAERAAEGDALLRYGFREFEVVTIAQAGKVIETAPVWVGSADTVELAVAESLSVTLPRGEGDKISYAITYQSPIEAPVEKGKAVGKLTVKQGDTIIRETDLITASAVEEAGFFKRVMLNAKRYIGQ